MNRILQVCLLLYTAVSVLYTTDFLLSNGLRFVSNSLSSDIAPSFQALGGLLSNWLSSSSTHAHDAKGHANTVYDSLVSAKTDDVMYWRSSLDSPLRVKAPRGDKPVSMRSSLFLGKALASSHEHLTFEDKSNLEVIPYYYRGSARLDHDDITITTLVTRNRFAVFHQLVDKYKGPISVTVHVSQLELLGRSQNGFLDALHRLYTSSPLMSMYVDVHLVVTPSAIDRQFNTWRNVARMFARTDYVMMLDVDFVPCTDFRTRLRTSANDEVKALLQSGSAATVIPAFEYVKHEDGLDASVFPEDKEVGPSLKKHFCSEFWTADACRSL